MPQDAYTLRLVAAELDRTLAGGRINRVNQPDKEEISLVIYTGKRTLKLVLNANASMCGAYFSEEERENPLVAPNFCMLLRKRLLGAEILGVDTPGFERILRFRMRCPSDFSEEERVLHAEIMGKYSNLILTENGVVLGALKTTSLDDACKRMIFAGVKYVLPAPQDKADPSDLSALSAALDRRDGDLAHLLFTRVAGIAPCTAEQIVARYRGGDLARHTRDFLFSDEVSPCVVLRDGEPADFFARREPGSLPFDTLSEAQAYFYGRKRQKRRTDDLRRKLLAAVNNSLKKHEKRLALATEKRLSCADLEQNRVKGEILTANLWQLRRGDRACELPNFYDENGTSVKIALDPLLTPAENAQAYFKRYRKQKRTLEAVAPQEQGAKRETEYCRNLLSEIAAAETAEDLECVREEIVAAGLLPAPAAKPGKKRAESPFRTYEYGGFRIDAGRNNLQNDRLVRTAAPHDVWLHAQKYHSCHVVIRTEGKPVPDDVLAFAASVCARFSDGGGDRIPVDHCLVSRVKKPPGAKAGFVTYSEYKTVYADPSRIP